MLTLDELKKNAQERKNSAASTKKSSLDEIKSNAVQIKKQRAQEGWSNFAKRYQNEVDRYKAGPYTSLWGKSADEIKSIQSENANRVSALLQEANVYRDVFGEDVASSVVESLTGLKAAYTSIHDNADIFSKFKSEEEYQAAVDQYLVQQKEEEELLNFDVEAGQKEIEALEAERDALEIEMWTNASADTHKRDSEIEVAINQKKQYLENAKWFQKVKQLKNADDFEKYSSMGAAIENPTFEDASYNYNILGIKGGNEEIGNIVTFSRDNWIDVASQNNESTIYPIGNILYHYMTEDEVKTYNYLLAKEGSSVAQEFLNHIEDVLNQRMGSSWANNAMSIDNGILKTLALGSLGFSAGVDQAITGTRQFFTDDALPTTPIQYANAEISDSLDGFGKYAYQASTTVGNMAPSILVSALTTPAGGAIAMGVSSAGNAYGEALRQGYGEVRARNYGILVGASEATLQYILGGIGSLGGMSGKLAGKIAAIDNSLLRISAKLGVSIGSEILEEELQLYLEPAFRSIILGEDYDAPTIDEIVETAIVTALSTGVLEGSGIAKSEIAASAQQNAQLKDTGRTIMSVDGGVDALKNLANEVAGVSEGEAKSKLTKQISKVENKVTAKRVGKLNNAVHTANNQANASANKADIAKSLQRKGFNAETANDIAEALVAEHNGQTLNKAQRKLLESAKKSKIVNEAISNIMMNERSTMGQRSQNIRDFHKEIETGTIAKTFGVSKETLKEMAEGKVTDETENAPESQYEVSVDGKTIDSKGNVINIVGVESVKDGKMILKTETGTIDSSEVQYASEADALIYEAVAKMGASPESAWAMIKAFNEADGVTAQAYATAAPLAYLYGKLGYEKGVFADGKPRLSLTATQSATAYQMGRSDAEASVKATKQASTESTLSEKNADKEIIFEGFTYSKRKANPVQKASMEAIELINKMSSLEIHVYKSYKKNGKFYTVVNGKERIAPNGYFRDGNKIYVDINAGNMGEGLMLYTLAHEVGHYIAKWNAQDFKAISDFLFEHYGENVPVYDLLEAQKRKLKKSYKRDGKQIPGEAQLEKEAHEELVCDMLSRMLADKHAYDKLMELKQKDLKLHQKLGLAIKRALDKLAKALGIYDTLNPDFAFAASAENIGEEAFRQLQDMYIKAFVQADANYQAAEKNTTDDGGVKLMARESVETDRQNKNRASSDSPLTRRSVKQRSVGSTHVKMSSTAAAEILGIENIADCSDSVKNAIAVLGEFFVSVDTTKPVLGFKKTISASNLEGSLIAQNVLKREGTSGSAYRYDGGHALRISKHSANAENFLGEGEHLSIALFERGKMNDFIEGESNVIEAVFRQRYLDNNPEALKQVIHDIAHFIAKGEYHDTAGAMHYNFSGTEAFKETARQRMEKDELARRKMFHDRDYSYDALISKPDMVVTTVDSNVPKNRADVVVTAKKNAARVGRFDPKTGNVSVRVDDIDTDVLLTTAGLRHGLDRRFNINAPVTVMIGEILKNSIRINEMIPSKETAAGSYALIGAAKNADGQIYIVRSVVNRFSNEVASVEVLYAVNAKTEPNGIKKGNQAGDNPQGSRSENRFLTGSEKSAVLNAPRVSIPDTDSTISIAELLDHVNRYFPDILPEDVLKHFGHDSRPEGSLGEDALYSERDSDSVSNRSLLANAFEGVAQNEIEKNKIQEYKSKIDLINAEEQKLQELNEQIKELSFAKGPRDTKKIRSLQLEAQQTANRISIYDKQLLRLEASKPLQDILTREKKKAYKRAEQRGKEALAAYKEEATKTQRALLEKWQESRKKGIENREKTAMRQKIRKVVRDLDKLLNRGNKKTNVKEDMKGFVSKALELADYLFTDHISNDELIRRGITVRMTQKEAALVKETEGILLQIYDNADSLTDEEFARLDAKRKSNLDKLRDLLTAQRNERLNTPVYNLFNDLVTEYASLKSSKQEAVKTAYDPNVERFLRSYIGESDGETDSDRKTLLQNMRVADMTTDELWKLHNAYTMVLHSVRYANKVWVKGKTDTVEQVAGMIIGDFLKRKTPDGNVDTVIRNLSNKFGWNYEKLYYALDRIGSETFTELVMNIANSENIVMQDVIEATAFRDEMVKKYGYNNWDVNKKIDREFIDNTGKKFNLTLGELMSLYAYSRRKGAWDHIEYGGFVFGEAALTNPKPADSYKLSKEQCEAITNTLTNEQKAYAEDMQKFLSETMGAKGNEVSMLMYGITMFGEKNYFPIHIAGQFKVQANESQAKAAAGFSSMSNAGFTHAQNPNAKAPFVLEGFNEIWADHVNEMSRYHGTVPALEDMRRVMNRSFYSESGAESIAIKQLMENSFGKEAVEYFDNLYREANSGAITDKLQKSSHKLLSKFRKNSVAYSLSVLIQQPASVVRAYALIPKKYFRGIRGIGALPIGIAQAATSKWTKSYKNAYAEMLKYAPGVTMAKEIGGFDTASGNSIRSYLLDTEKSFVQKLKTETVAGKAKAVYDLLDDNPIANLPNVADKIAWIEIWNACKRETVAKHKDLAPNSDAFMEQVGKRFTEVIRATQVYDSIFAKSPMLKSKNLAVQYLVSFMNEANTTANLAESAVRDFIRGDIAKGLRKATTVVRSVFFACVLKSIIYAMRDDDEDETYIEKYTESLVESLLNDITVFNYIPIAKDVWSVAQGYDVERPDMSIVSDAISSITNVVNNAHKDTSDMTEEELEEWDKKVADANWKLADSICAFFGIPMKNVRREINALMDHARIAHENSGKTTWASIEDAVYQAIANASPSFAKPDTESKQDKLYDAIINGDTAYVNRLKGGYKDQNAINNAIRTAIKNRYKAGGVDYDTAKRHLVEHGGMEEDDAYWKIEEWKYEWENGDDFSKYNEFYEAVQTGKNLKAVIKEYTDNGVTTETLSSQITAHFKPMYIEMSTSEKAGIKGYLLNAYEQCGVGREDATKKLQYWDFLSEWPDSDLNQYQIADYYEFAKPAGISAELYEGYCNKVTGIEGEDKKARRMAVIHALPISNAQKDALYYAEGWAASKLYEAPWH